MWTTLGEHDIGRMAASYRQPVADRPKRVNGATMAGLAVDKGSKQVLHVTTSHPIIIDDLGDRFDGGC